MPWYRSASGLESNHSEDELRQPFEMKLSLTQFVNCRDGSRWNCVRTWKIALQGSMSLIWTDSGQPATTSSCTRKVRDLSLSESATIYTRNQMVEMATTNVQASTLNTASFGAPRCRQKWDLQDTGSVTLNVSPIDHPVLDAERTGFYGRTVE